MATLIGQILGGIFAVALVVGLLVYIVNKVAQFVQVVKRKPRRKVW